METTKAAVDEASSGIRAVERALRLLVVTAEASAGIGLVEAARAVELAPSTVTRLFRTLESSGFVHRRDDGSYVAGAELTRLGALQGPESPLLALAQQHLDQLAMSTGESCYLAVPVDDDWATYVRMAESSRAVRHVSWLGRRIPRQGSAAGAALAGNVGGNGAAIVHAGVEADTTAIAAPVRIASSIVAAINVVGPSFRMTPTIQKSIAASARQTVQDIERQITNSPDRGRFRRLTIAAAASVDD